MMRIELDDPYILTSDSRNLILGKHAGYDKHGREVLNHKKYFQEFEGLFKAYLRLRVYSATSTTLKQLKNHINDVENHISELVKTIEI